MVEGILPEMENGARSAGTSSGPLFGERRPGLPHCLAGLFLLSGLLAPAAAQIRTDGSAGAAQTLSGPHYTIPQGLGTVAGNNLFHSFYSFSIAGGESATFQTSVTGNVISRVTGGAPSSINGALNLTASGGATPAFWFINPAGIVFGAGAEINVPGAFHVGTADYLAFADGSRFHADLAQASTFSTAQPEAFGFLGNQRQSVQILDGAFLYNGNDALTIVAGDVRIDNLAEVRTTGGDIRIVALGQQAAEVGVTGALPVAQGLLEIRNDSVVQSHASSGQQGGNVVAAAGEMVVDYSFFRARTSSSGNSGAVWVETGDLSVVNDSRFGSRSDGSGNAGSVTVLARGDVTVSGGSVIASNSLDEGAAGDIYLEAANLRIADMGAIQSDAQASGNAGSVAVVVSGQTEILGAGAWITSDAYSVGNAGSVSVQSGSLYIDAQGGQAGITSETVGAGSTGNAGAVTVAVTGAAMLYDGGRISSSTAGSGYAGGVTVSAASLLADGLYAGSITTGIVSDAAAGSSGDAGYVQVSVADSLQLINGGVISSSSKGSGAPGWIEVNAGSVFLSGRNGSGTYSAISSDAGPDSTGGFSGYVAVTAGGDIQLTDEARISTNSEGGLAAGYLDVHAGGEIRLGNGAFIASDASGSGRAGDVQVSAASLTMSGDGSRSYISSDALGIDNDAGSVSVAVDGAVSLSQASISSDSYGGGLGGSVSLSAASLSLDSSAYITSDAVGSGQAGNVFVSVTGLTSLRGGSWISSDTYDSGNAGTVYVQTGSLLLDGQGSATGISSEALFGSSGEAGAVTVEVAGHAELRDGGQISSSTYAAGNAGLVQVSAGSLSVDGAGTALSPTGVITTADVGAGHAGYVIVESPGTVRVVNGGQISSSTASEFGAAGVVLVVARDVLVDGLGSSISARAEAGSSGETGYVAVVPSASYGWTTMPIVTDSITVANGGEISIANHASTPFAASATPGYIHLEARNITVKDASVTANSTGNFAASDIYINFGDRLFVDPSQISTSSNEGNGGNIAIQGGRVAWLDRSQITTSVASFTNGNGGDISISADYLVMNNGFIQANTNAPASGGDIAINVSALVSSYNSLQVGGAVPLLFDANAPGYNVIQAAAPDGVSGNIEITSPALDLAGSLADIRAQTLQGGGLGRSPCDTTAGSSLAAVGRGGLPPSAREALRVEPAPATATASPDKSAELAVPLQLAQAVSLECRSQ